MSSAYFEPWVGPTFSETNTLILSESTYDWVGDNGQAYTPQPSHPEDSIAWNIQNFGKNSYFTAMNRVISGESEPSAETMRACWDRHAYTIFVQQTVGIGAGIRPTDQHWQEAGPHFLELLAQLRPQKVIVTGKDMWNRMPECSVRLLDDLQAYSLLDGQLVWCLALHHPANRTEGFAWRKIAESVRMFETTEFPIRLSNRPKGEPEPESRPYTDVAPWVLEGLGKRPKHQE